MSQEYWLQFLELYKSLPCLWDIKSKTYMNKFLKVQAYQQLLKKYKEFDRNGSIDSVKRKIDSFRSCYRREYKKVLESQKNGYNPDEIYSPTLWYYDHLTFLSSSEEVSRSANTSIEEIVVDYNNDEHEATDDVLEPVPKKKKRVLSNKKTKLLDLAQSLLNKQEEEDECSSFCKNLNLQMRGLITTQKYMAQKLISEVMFHGRMEQLNFKTSINIGDPMESFQITSPSVASDTCYSPTQSPEMLLGDLKKMQEESSDGEEL